MVHDSFPQADDAPRQAAPGFRPFEAAPATRPPRAARAPLAGIGLATAQHDELGIGALLRFKSLMAADGQPVQLARLCYDRLYAYERIAVAHSSGDQALRHLALELFQIYHRRQSAGLAGR